MKDRLTVNGGREKTWYTGLENLKVQEGTAEVAWRYTKVVWKRMLQTTTDFKSKAQGIAISKAMFRQTHCWD